MRLSRTTRVAWLAAISLAVAPGVALAADSGAPKGESTLQKAKENTKDTWLTTKVKSALLADTEVSGTAVHVETEGGVVTLTGTVKSEAVKAKAERIASAVEGVQSVRNDLRVQAGKS